MLILCFGVGISHQNQCPTVDMPRANWLLNLMETDRCTGYQETVATWFLLMKETNLSEIEDLVSWANRRVSSTKALFYGNECTYTERCRKRFGAMNAERMVGSLARGVTPATHGIISRCGYAAFNTNEVRNKLQRLYDLTRSTKNLWCPWYYRYCVFHGFCGIDGADWTRDQLEQSLQPFYDEMRALANYFILFNDRECCFRFPVGGH